MPSKSDPERIKRLNACLFQAQQALRAVLPPDVLQLMTGCRALSREEVYLWMERTANDLLKSADRRPGEHMGDRIGTERAYCPACGGGTSDPNLRGFSYPRGLEMHLRGEMNATPCPVLKFYFDTELEDVQDPAQLEFRRHLYSSMPK